MSDDTSDEFEDLPDLIELPDLVPVEPFALLLPSPAFISIPVNWNAERVYRRIWNLNRDIFNRSNPQEG